jgi:hypothetical protein
VSAMRRFGLALLALVVGVSAAHADSFQQRRRAFRREIDKKKTFDIQKDLKAVLYDSDAGRFTFAVAPPERDRLAGLVRGFFGVGDGDAGRILDEVASGKIVVKKDYRKGDKNMKGVQMSAFLLIPAVPYWHRIESIDRAEQTFHVFNVTSSFWDEGALPVVYGFYQPEGTFSGVTRATTVPMKATRKRGQHRVIYSTPSQIEINQALAAMPASSPERAGLPERFIDRARKHPLYAEQDKNGNYVVSDKEILKVLLVLTDMANRCEVRDTSAYYQIHEGFAGFHAVEYTISSMANINALFPNIPLLRSMVESIAQSVADQVSWKYFSLSMKNLRDAVAADAQRRGRR